MTQCQEGVTSWGRFRKFSNMVIKKSAGSAFSQVVEICHTKNINNILAVGKVTGHLTPMAAYDMANFPDKHGWRRKFRLAVVALGKSWRSNLFAETVANNRGYTLKVFDNEQDAKTWLFES